MKRSSLLFPPILLMLGCSGASPSISEQITKQFKASQTEPIDLSAVGPASWERVCILSPYSTNQSAEKVLGFKWDVESKTPIAGSDGINVLVFVQEQRVVAYTEHPRNLGDFSKLQPRCLVRSQATVDRESDGSGWVFFVAR
jgi:hypothetical protein